MKNILFDQARSGTLQYLDRMPLFINPLIIRNLAAILSLILLFSAYYLLPGLKVFGLDEVHYYPSFEFKLMEEGRWINFMLHHGLRQMPLVTYSLLFLFCSWVVLFRIASNFSQDSRYAVIIASVLLMAPSFVHQSLWPATHFPTVITLLILTWLAEKGVSHRIIYLLGGFLLFGMMQNYYFILPLLFLGRLDSENQDAGKIGTYLFSHFFFWILGSIVGFVLALVAIFIITGQVGITPAEWRQAMPVQDFQGLIRNVFFVIQSLKAEVLLLFMSGTNNNPVYLLGLMLLLVFRFQFWRSGLPKVIILLAVSISFFVFSIPLAAAIATRSLVALSSAIIILLLVSSQLRHRTYWLSVFLLLWMGSNFSINAHSYLNVHKTETEFILQKIVTVLPQHPSNYNALAIFGKVDEKYKEAKLFNDGPFTRPIVLAAGFNSFWECRMSVPKECDALGKKLNLSSITANKTVEFVGVSEDIAVILFGSE